MRTVLLVSLLFITVAVAAQRNKPVIIGQNSLATPEEQPITIRLTDLQVRDRNDIFYPFGFRLTVYPGDHYTLNGSTVTPDKDFNGTLSVPVSVNDGKFESDQYTVKIHVLPVNDPPVITAQTPLTTVEQKSLTLTLSHLTVQDPDNIYPNDFTLHLSSGNNYYITGNSITPYHGFTGTLLAPVRVFDGTDYSAWFTLNVTVLPANKPPVITGQSVLSVLKNQPVAITLTHLTVQDPDSRFPEDFVLKILPGNNYTVNGSTVTPARDFTGTLTVSVVVNDTHSDSEPFPFKIEVRNQLTIIGHIPLETDEDTPITLTLQHLQVHDPTGTYPSGFSLNIQSGKNYSVNQRSIIPSRDYAGTLEVPVTVGKEGKVSDPYTVRITVKPVNDPPVITFIEKEPLRYQLGDEPVRISPKMEIHDADHEWLLAAEVRIIENFEADADVLSFTTATGITGKYEAAAGTLMLSGRASVAEYQEVLRSVHFERQPVAPLYASKKIHFAVDDGEASSEPAERNVLLTDEIVLDIPTGFTPNNDRSNDTWKIRPVSSRTIVTHVMVRVYNKRGLLVFETSDLEKEWDGRWDGELLPADSYFYIIEVTGSLKPTLYKGVVTLLR